MNVQSLIHTAPRSGAQAQPNWFAVYTYPKAEKLVYRRILEMGVEAFLPLHQVVRQWSDRKKQIEVPLFPNYVFVRTTLKRQYELGRIHGLVRFITCDDRPVSIPEKVINDIKKLMVSDVQVYENAISYKVGESVKVVNGQFAGTEGYLVSINGKSRLVVHIEVLQRLVSLEVDPHCVLPLT